MMISAISLLKFPDATAAAAAAAADAAVDDDDDDDADEIFADVEFNDNVLLLAADVAKLSATECCELAMVANVTGFLKPLLAAAVVEKLLDDAVSFMPPLAAVDR